MPRVKSVEKPVGGFESFSAKALDAPRHDTKEGAGTAGGEPSRSLRDLVVKGKSEQPVKSRPAPGGFESVINTDERVRILDTDLAPWRRICALRMQAPDGAGYIGTGWFVGPKTLLTAGHCVYSKDFYDGWATSIEVIPGLNRMQRPFGARTSTRFAALDLWMEREDPDFDVACIHLDDDLGNRTGWFQVATMPAADLQNYRVNVAGYPGDRGAGSELYHDHNRVVRVSERRVFYETDTYGGQSGAPAWIHETESGPPIAIGIHAYGIGGTPSDFGITANSAPRIIPEVLEHIESWIKADGA